ncbi:toxin-antitoxin system YwqK family antitoxin [Helicobacter bilis]|uniref:Toxin-antitoxin system YwqK family antitoxin n=2 Tax=Helicobacter bilis TaxID=37372 RepID=A0A6D2C1Y7_9HELI|nr:toxin-antitoxin system YwqK family antitoxin [Helicobacter bilis]EMZ40092.1 hypothetical protein C826_00927 [Helicobacter bilis WiWa]TLE02002.1 toxin-antitoxin system YwqK family antitoxin [Helicobacter bilis]
MLLKSVFIGFLSFHSVDTPILKECKTEADKISGCVEKKYDLNGKLWRETPYKNGKIEGIEKWYYENGNLNIEIPFKNDKREGMVKWYYESGNLESEIPHKNDEAHGNLKYYTEDGKLLALLKAENGKITSGKCSNNKAPTNKDLEEIGRFYNAGKAINYLKEICLEESDSK